MTAAPVFMLRTVTSAGLLDKFLPDFTEMDMSPIFCDAGSLTFGYPKSGTNFSLLAEDLEIAVTMNGTEIAGMRSVIETLEGDDADDAEGGAVWKLTARTMVGQLDYAIVYPKNWPATKIVNYAFTNQTPGVVLRLLLQAAQTRGALAGITWTFTDTLDSDGNAWGTTTSVAYDAGTTLSSVLSGLVDNGMIEFKMDKRVLKVYKSGGMGVDHSTGTSPVRFIKGRDIKESPRKIDTRNLATALLVGGNNGGFAENLSDSTHITKYGRRETYASVDNIHALGILQFLGQYRVSNMDDPQIEITHGLHFETQDNPRPVTNFDVGDWALSDVGQGLSKFRILQWVISVANDGSCTGSIVLNNFINTQLSKIASRVNKIENGSTATGAKPTKDDGLAPGVPPNVVLSTGYYIVSDWARATLIVQWDPVTLNEDGTAIEDLAHYQVRWKYSSDSAWRANTRIETDSNAIVFQNLDTNVAVQAQVQAVDIWSRGGSWSTLQTITTAHDTVAPLQPSPAIVTSNVGTLRVVWTGLDYLGATMAADTAGVQVHVSTSDFTPTSGTLKDFLPTGTLATTITQGLSFNTEYWVKFVAVDTAGNASAASATTSTSHAILKQVVSTDIGGNVIDFSNIRFKDIGNFVPDGSFELATTQTLINGLASTFGIGVATNPDGATALPSPNVLSFNLGGNGSLYKITAGIACAPGQKVVSIYSWKAVNLAGADVADLVLGFNLVNGTTSYVNVKAWSSATNNSTWTLREAVVTTAPANTISMDIMTKSVIVSGSTAKVYVDQWEVRFQTPTALIEDLAVTTAKIALLAVNDAQIGSASIGKLTVGTLSADMTLSARIKTADTGVRVEVNSGGIGAWNSSGTQTVAIASSDGSVKILGTLSSGAAGRRIDINPFGTGLPEIRFYPTTGSNYGYLNAVSGGTDASVGLNSGTFTANSQTCGFRVYMTSTLMTLETIRTDTQAQLGGGIYVSPTQVTASTMLGSTRHGFLDLYNGTDGASGLAAGIGHDGATDANDVWFSFYLNGSMDTIGTWVRNSSNSNAAVQNDTWSLASSVSGATVSWPVTMDSTVYPVVQARDSPAIATMMSALSTSAFTITYDGSTTGASALHWWGWR